MESITTVLLAGIAGLVSAVSILFRIVMKQSKDQVEQMREQTKLSERIGKVEGEHKGITELSERTLEVVHAAIKGED